MRKKILLTATLIIAILLLIHPYVYTRSAGAPIGKTGAPNENTCNGPYCHGGNPLNSPDGDLTIKLIDQEDEVKQYIPGKQYKIRVELSKPNSIKWGFQSTVRISLNAEQSVGILNT